MDNTQSAVWDNAADNYQQVFSLGISEYNRRVLDFLRAKGHIFPGSRVLDVGCGVGKYGTYLAALGCRVALNDISPKMLAFAKENMKAYPETEFYPGDFASPSFPSDTGSFELVMSTMSPAVSSSAAIKKMISLSHGGVFIARFAQWSQPTRTKLLMLAGLSAFSDAGGVEEDCRDFENALRSTGNAFEKQLQPYSWSDPRTPEQLAAFTVRSCGIEDSPEIRRKLISAASLLADDSGLISDEVNTITAWYYLKGSAEI